VYSASVVSSPCSVVVSYNAARPDDYFVKSVAGAHPLCRLLNRPGAVKDDQAAFQFAAWAEVILSCIWAILVFAFIVYLLHLSALRWLASLVGTSTGNGWSVLETGLYDLLSRRPRSKSQP